MVYYINIDKNHSSQPLWQKGRPVITNPIPNDSPLKKEPRPAPAGLYTFTALASAYLTVSTVIGNAYMATASIILILSYLLVFLRSRAGTILVGVAAVFFYTFTGSVSTVAFPLSFIFAVGMGAASLGRLNKLLCLGLGLASTVAIWLLSGDVTTAAYSLAIFFPMVLLWQLLAKSVKRIPALCIFSVALIAIVLIPFAMVLAEEYGSLSAETISQFINDLHDEFLNATMESRELLPAEYQEMITEDFFSAVFDSVMLLSPSLLIVTANIISFFTHLLALALGQSGKSPAPLDKKVTVFSMSPVSAILFLISLVVILLGLGSSDTGVVVSVTLQNLCIILFPPFALIGGLGILQFLRAKPGCLNVWVIVALIFFALYAGVVLLLPLALLGAIMTLKKPKNNPPS